MRTCAASVLVLSLVAVLLLAGVGMPFSAAQSNCLAESPHPYDNNMNQTWTVTNPDTAAAYSRVHFSCLET